MNRIINEPSVFQFWDFFGLQLDAISYSNFETAFGPARYSISYLFVIVVDREARRSGQIRAFDVLFGMFLIAIGGVQYSLFFSGFFGPASRLPSTFPAPGPYTVFSGPGSLNRMFRPGALQKRSGTFSNASVMFISSNWHVEIRETSV